MLYKLPEEAPDKFTKITKNNQIKPKIAQKKSGIVQQIPTDKGPEVTF